MFRPSNIELAAALAASWAGPVYLLGRAVSRLRAAAPTGPAAWPAVTVVCAAKGWTDAFAGNVRALLEQDYPGRCEVVFVSPRADDPAARAISGLLAAAPAGRGRLCVSDAVPERCSEKILNLTYGLGAADRASAVLAFIDLDARPPRGWLKGLVAALDAPGAGASTTHGIYAPVDSSLASLVRMAMCGYSACGMASGRVVVGWSWAMRRETFDALRVAELWSGSLADDVVLGPLVRAAGLHVEWAPEAGIDFWDAGGWSALRRNSDRAFFYLFHYDRATWTLAALGAAGTAGVAAACFLPPVRWWAAAALVGGHMAVLGLMFAALTRGREAWADQPFWRPAWVWSGLTAPFLLAVYLASLARSLVAKDLDWGGYTYHLEAPFRVRVSVRAEAA